MRRDGPRETPNPFYEHAKYVWVYPESRLAGHEDWSAGMDELAEGRNWRCLADIPDSWMSGVRGGARFWPGGGHLWILFREFLRRSFEAAQLQDKYDWLIITRSDMLYPIAHPPLELFSPDCVHVPDAERYNGFTDRHMLVPRAHFQKVLDLPRDVFERPADLARRMNALGRSWNTEGYIKFRFGEMGLLSKVRFFPYYMYLVRSPAGVTRWVAGTFNEELRLFVKYQGEFVSSRLVQVLVSGEGDWKHLIGPRRYLNWRIYAYAAARTHWEKASMPGRFRSLRMLRRFLVIVRQPLETGKIDRFR